MLGCCVALLQVNAPLPQPKSRYTASKRGGLVAESLINTLPEDLRAVYADLYQAQEPSEDELYLRRLVKAADKISALIKCIEEAQAGNAEFACAQQTCQACVDALASELPEVADFVAEFLPPYGSTLDELLSR